MSAAAKHGAATRALERPLDIAAGARLRALRMRAGMTQQELGRAIGVTFQQIQKYETGANRMAVSTLLRICDALGRDPVDILPRRVSGGAPAPDPFAALGASIGGYELAGLYARMTPEQQRAQLIIARSMVVPTREAA